jgi:hypothetical protein
MVHVVGDNMFEPMFKKIKDNYYDSSFKSFSVHYVNKLKLLIWSGDADKLYQQKTLIYASAKSPEGLDVVIGYCDPNGFWYLRNNKLCLCKWNHEFNELSDYSFSIFIGFPQKNNYDVGELGREFKRVMSLANMTNMYENRLSSSLSAALVDHKYKGS